MATLAQLQAEPWWSRETIPPALAKLRSRLLNHWALPSSAIGIKGDYRHLRGYHRSREWVKNSRYATNRSYSVSETPGNRAGGDSRWIAAMDITLPRDVLLAVCRRLDSAVRSGKLEKVTEWYGNLNGDTRVDGYDNIRDRVASSDTSHLWHLHISFDRGRVNEDHTDLFNILTGDLSAMGDIYCKQGDQGGAVYELQWTLAELGFDPGPLDGIYGPRTAAALVAAGVTGGVKDGSVYYAYEHFHLQRKWVRKVAAETVGVHLPARVTITGELRPAD